MGFSLARPGLLAGLNALTGSITYVYIYGAGGIMFSGCPSVRPSEAWNTLFPPVHGSIGPSNQRWPFCGISVCQSVRPERFPDICRRTHGGNGLKYCMLMYLGHLQNWLVYGHGLLNFQILVLYWLSEMGQIWRTYKGNSMKFCMLIYLDHLQNRLVHGHGLFIFLMLALYWLSEMGQIWGFRAFSGEPMKEMACNFACWCILTIVYGHGLLNI